MTHRCLRILGRLPRVLSALLLAGTTLLMGGSGIHISSLAISPATVDVSAAAQTVVITGVDSQATALSACLTLSTDSSQTTGYIDGTLASGAFSVNLAIPAHAGAGTWLLTIHSKEGNPAANYSTKNLQDSGFPATVTVVSVTADTTPPALQSVGLSPATIDTTSVDQAINATFSVTDNQSGTTAVGFWITGPDAKVYSGSAPILAGTALSGTWSGAVTIPSGSVPGAYQLTQVSAQDALGNTRFYLPADYASLGTSSVQNNGKLGQTIAFGTIADRTYGDPAFDLSATASSGLPVTFLVVSGPATLNGSTLTPTGAGYVTVRASQAGDGTYIAAPDVDRVFLVNKAAATIKVDGWTGTYDGNPHGATGAATGVKGETLAGLDPGASFTNVPGGTATWTFTDATGNYENATGTAAIVISKAEATIKVDGWTGTYDGNPHGATGAATGVKGETLAGLDSGASFTNVPGGTAHWAFSGGINYNNRSGDAAIVIGKATARIVLTPFDVIYDGSPHTASGTATGVKGESLAGLELAGTTHLDPGAYTDAWAFTDGTGNYNNASGTITDRISYGFNGLLSPYDPNRIYKVKSAIPLKWQYTNASGSPVPSGTAGPVISIVKVSDNASADAEILLQDSGNSGYQYDAITATWQFNWKTTGLSGGTYAISIKAGSTGQVNGIFLIRLGQ